MASISVTTLFQAARAIRAHLMSTDLGKEIADLRSDVKGTLAARLVGVEFSAPEPATTNAIKTAIASSVTPASYSGAALNGAVGGAKLSTPRKPTVTTAGGTAADAPATATFTGLDENGAVQTETVNVSQTAATVTATKFFSKITQIDLAAADGTGATLAFGFSKELRLPAVPVSRAGLAAPIQEIANGAVVTSGALSVANRSYTPSAAPDGTINFYVAYETALS